MPEYSEYTPTIEEVRDNYMSGVAWVAEGFDRGVGFDRMTARVKAEAGAAALETAADDLHEMIDEGVDPIDWLRVRADALRSALEGEHTEPGLDPEPWVSVTGVRHDGRLGTRYSSSVNPRPGFDQDPAHYPGGNR